MERRKENIIRLFLLFFIVSISTTVIPSGTVTIYGVLGEAQGTAVVREQLVEVVEQAQRALQHSSVKGVTVLNIWLVLWAGIVVLIYASYRGKVRPVQTIVSLKVRMDD